LTDCFTHRRQNLKVKPQLNLGSVDYNKPITLIVGASGLTVSNKGNYRGKMDTSEKEFIKLHVVICDWSKKVVSFRITKGNVYDTKQFGPFIKESAKKHDIDKVYGDKAYDDRKNFNIVDEINAEQAMSIRCRWIHQLRDNCLYRLS
jgi:hypothetical protein